uniref:RING-type domain-containing protein n=1 Tax=Anopheles quadriannulatus TaxID=34691 RepID=A0A182WTS3_ANOQN
MELSCSVCSELYVPEAHVVSTPCGHMFHNDCIRQWLERSKTCPDCRASCISTKLIKMHFNVTAHLARPTSQRNNADAVPMESLMDNITIKLSELEDALRRIEQKTEQSNDKQDVLSVTVHGLVDEIRMQNTVINDLENKMDLCTVGLGDFLTNILDSS